MKSESDVVMTPDYAKKVFQSKAGKAKASYYKWYAGTILLLFLAGVLYGMFQLLDESNQIDQKLARLKVDPMPGTIKPQLPKKTPVLFATKKTPPKSKVAKILAEADMPESTAGAESGSTATAAPANKPTVAASVASGKTPPAVKHDAMKSASIAAPRANNNEQTSRPARHAARAEARAKKTFATAVKPSMAATAATPRAHAHAATKPTLAISSHTRPSRKAQMLVAAYQAYKQGKMDQAARQYDAVLTLDPVNRNALLGRAAVYVLENDYQPAIDLYQRLLQQNPKDSLAMTSLISVANIDPLAGESKIKSMLAEQPDSPYLNFVLGNMYGDQQRWQQAQQAYFKALQLKPDDADYAYNLAVSLDHIGQKTAARQYYQRALEASKNTLVRFNIQLARARLEALSR